MKRSKDMNKVYKVSIILIFLSILSFSCSGQSKTEGELPDIGTIHIGYLPILPSAPFFIAQEKGYFTEQGLDVELESFNSASFQMPLLATGDLDFGSGQVGTEIINAIGQGLDIKIVGGNTQEHPGQEMAVFLVRKDLFDSGAITQVEDLKGATISYNVERGLSEYLVTGVLSRVGLTLEDVNIVTMPFPDMNAAFANKAIDAAHDVPPLAGQVINDGNAVVLFNFEEYFKNAQTGVVYFGKRILEPENREVGVRLLVAYLKAVRDLYGEGWTNEENATITSNYTHIPVPAIIHSVEPFIGPNGELNQTFIEDIMMYYFDQGYTELSEPLPLSKIVDSSFMDEAMKRIGNFEE
jgi:NitT/TauT family transport system substrate-binding protein